jgi:exodeoxyribonuclease VII small subunit
MSSSKPSRSRQSQDTPESATQDGPSPGRRSRSRREQLERSEEEEWLAETSQLSFAQSRTALDLALARLQSDELEVEEMAGLYRRAVAYANRCDQVLRQVEQEVEELDLNLDDQSP